MYLSFEFNKITLIKRNELTASDWLKTHFETANMKQHNDGRVTASLPSIFVVKSIDMTVENIFNFVVKKRNVQAIPLPSVTGNKKIVHKKLIENLFSAADKNDNEVCMYRPKVGQDSDILKPSETYRTVHRDDRIHDHSDPRLIDFSVVRILNLGADYYPFVEEQNFEAGAHYHLLAH